MLIIIHVLNTKKYRKPINLKFETESYKICELTSLLWTFLATLFVFVLNYLVKIICSESTKLSRSKQKSWFAWLYKQIEFLYIVWVLLLSSLFLYNWFWLPLQTSHCWFNKFQHEICKSWGWKHAGCFRIWCQSPKGDPNVCIRGILKRTS